MEKDKIVRTTIRVPKPLWDRTRICAVEENTTAEALVVDALTTLLDARTEFLKKDGN